MKNKIIDSGEFIAGGIKLSYVIEPNDMNHCTMIHFKGDGVSTMYAYDTVAEAKQHIKRVLKRYKYIN